MPPSFIPRIYASAATTNGKSYWWRRMPKQWDICVLNCFPPTPPPQPPYPPALRTCLIKQISEPKCYDVLKSNWTLMVNGIAYFFVSFFSSIHSLFSVLHFWCVNVFFFSSWCYRFRMCEKRYILENIYLILMRARILSKIINENECSAGRIKGETDIIFI